MTILINDNDKCHCGAYFQENGFCVNGHLHTKIIEAEGGKSYLVMEFGEKEGIPRIDIPLGEVGPISSGIPTCKEALKQLNLKEKELKESILKAIIRSKASDAEIVRVLAFLINSFKRT